MTSPPVVFLVTPSPFIPLPLGNGDGECFERGADAPLKHPSLLTRSKERGRLLRITNLADITLELF